MYFPVGWPKSLKIPDNLKLTSHGVFANRDRDLYAVLFQNAIGIWFYQPCVPLVYHQSSVDEMEQYGLFELVLWKPDSSALVITTTKGYLLIYSIQVLKHSSAYSQVDSSHAGLRRESAELCGNDPIPAIVVSLTNEVRVSGGAKSVVCIKDELMLGTREGRVLRMRWDGSVNRDYCLDLQRVPFCIDKQVALAVPIADPHVHVVDIEYSPLLGGFAVVLSDGRAAFLTASSLRFDPNQVQGIWAKEIDDGTCVAINHRYRLIAYGRTCSQAIVYVIDDITGALDVSHILKLSERDYSGEPGRVSHLRWSPDGCALALTWKGGGLALWSVFGSLLMCTLGWSNVSPYPLKVSSVEWGTEGYTLWLCCQGNETDKSQLLQLQLVKSALAANSTMSQQESLFLQGEDRLYMNTNETSTGVPSESSFRPHVVSPNPHVGNKQWNVVSIPYTYLGTNWPIRYAALDSGGHHVAVAGRFGFAHYSLWTRRWKLFGNESQEQDFVVTGGLLWWQEHLIIGCYNIPDMQDELRLYPRDFKLDNAYMRMVRVSSQVLLLSLYKNSIAVYCSDSHLIVYSLEVRDGFTGSSATLVPLKDIDLSALSVHPACVISITLTSLEVGGGGCNAESLLVNVCGRLFLLQVGSKEVPQENDNNTVYYTTMPTILASCVENLWVPSRYTSDKPHLTGALWLHCGTFGMRMWLPLFPDADARQHTFMSKRIMLPIASNIYPLAVLFEAAVLLGVETDMMQYLQDTSSPASLPFCVLERTSEVYLHHVLRQLLRKNLGLPAWEIATSCSQLPYFPHTLELLLHGVLEEEATSKEPLPDALLPSVIDFIREFPPLYLQTVVGCSRKSEIALWHYLFQTAGNPRDLFSECLQRSLLDVAAKYLVILQNCETSTVSRQYATLLLNASLDRSNWDLAKDLVRFLKAIDPNDVDAPRTSVSSLPPKFTMTPPVSPNEEDVSVLLGTVQVSRFRSVSSTAPPRGDNTATNQKQQRSLSETKSPLARPNSDTQNLRKISPKFEPSGTAEDLFLDLILQRHARKLLMAEKLRDLGRFAAHLEFPLVGWLRKENNRAAKVESFVEALKKLHSDFEWPFPVLNHPVEYYARKSSPVLPVLSVSTLSSPPATPLEEHLQTLRLGIGSLPKEECDSPTETMSVDTQLRPSAPKGSVESLYSGVESEQGSSLPGVEDPNEGKTFIEDALNSDLPSLSHLETLSQEMTNKGLPQAEMQLRFLQQQLEEPGCLEWSLLVSLILRDAMGVIRTLNAARLPSIPLDTLLRLQQGLQELESWTETECTGYKPLMQALENQVSLLQGLISQRTSSESRSRNPSISGIPLSSTTEVEEELQVTDSEEIGDNVNEAEDCIKEVKQETDSACVVS